MKIVGQQKHGFVHIMTVFLPAGVRSPVLMKQRDFVFIFFCQESKSGWVKELKLTANAKASPASPWGSLSFFLSLSEPVSDPLSAARLCPALSVCSPSLAGPRVKTRFCSGSGVPARTLPAPRAPSPARRATSDRQTPRPIRSRRIQAPHRHALPLAAAD